MGNVVTHRSAERTLSKKKRADPEHSPHLPFAGGGAPSRQTELLPPPVRHHPASQRILPQSIQPSVQRSGRQVCAGDSLASRSSAPPRPRSPLSLPSLTSPHVCHLPRRHIRVHRPSFYPSATAKVGTTQRFASLGAPACPISHSLAFSDRHRPLANRSCVVGVYFCCPGTLGGRCQPRHGSDAPTLWSQRRVHGRLRGAVWDVALLCHPTPLPLLRRYLHTPTRSCAERKPYLLKKNERKRRSGKYPSHRFAVRDTTNPGSEYSARSCDNREPELFRLFVRRSSRNMQKGPSVYLPKRPIASRRFG